MVPGFSTELIAGHPDAGVRNGNRVSGVVGVDRDCEGPVRLENSAPEVCRNRSFSVASAAFEMSSRMKISLSV